MQKYLISIERLSENMERNISYELPCNKKHFLDSLNKINKAYNFNLTARKEKGEIILGVREGKFDVGRITNRSLTILIENFGHQDIVNFTIENLMYFADAYPNPQLRFANKKS